MMLCPESIETRVFLKSRPKFQMGLVIAKTLSQRPKSTNLFRRFRNLTLRRLNIINLSESGAQLVLAGSTSSEQVKSQQLQTHRHFSYRSGHAPDFFNIDPNSLIQTSV